MSIQGRPAAPLNAGDPGDGEALFVSPHYDDVAFSCAATVAALCRREIPVRLVTVFTAGLHPAAGFALECQTGKGVPREVDYMALRREEDDRFVSLAGVETDRLGFLEAPHRGYESSAALFAKELPGDEETTREISRRLAEVLEDRRPCRLWIPFGVGGHVDHRMVRRAGLAAAAATAPRVRPAVYSYLELPYLVRARRPPRPPAGDQGGWRWVDLAPYLDFKAEAVGCYASQLEYQLRGLGGPSGMVRSGGRASAEVVGQDRLVELVWASEA